MSFRSASTHRFLHVAFAAVLWSSVWLPVSLSLLACGDDDGGGPVAADELPSELARAMCTAAERCGKAPAFDLAGCVSWLAARYADDELRLLLDGIEAGRIRYDAALAGECLDEVSQQSCAELDDITCDATFLEGTGELGATCSIDGECGEGLYCDRAVACPGVCASRAALGEECWSRDCERGQICLDGVCALALDEGDSCSPSAPACARGLDCIATDGSGQATCHKPRDPNTGKVGDECSDFSDGDGVRCGPNLACVPDDDFAAMRCRERVAPGQPCRAGKPNACTDDHYCTGSFDDSDGNGVCVPLPKAGEACNALADLECAFGLVCFEDGHCRQLQRLGDGCAGDDECASDNCQNGACATQSVCSE